MKKRLLTMLFCISYFAINTSAQNFSWANGMGGTVEDQGNSIVIDADGNVYTTGYFSGMVDFDPSTGTFNLISNGYYDVFITKFDNAGNFVWAKKIGASDLDQGMAIATDAIGNIYVGGSFIGTVDFDPNFGSHELTSTGGSPDAFILKLNSDGEFVWVKSFSGISSVIVNSIVVDAAGNIYSAGYFMFNVDFDPSANVNNLLTTAGSDAFVSKLDVNGDFVWAKGLTFVGSGGGTYYNDAKSLSLDGFGNVYTTGVFQGTVDFDPDVTGTFNLTSSNAGASKDMFLSKLDAAGNFKWAGKIGSSTNDDAGRSIATDELGNVYVAGYFSGMVDFDPGLGTSNITSNGNRDAFVLKLDSACGFLWAKNIGGTGNDNGYGLFVDSNSDVYVVGNFQNTVDFDLGTGTNNLSSNGGFDMYTLKLDHLGNYNWALSIGGMNFDEAVSVVVDEYGFVYSTGRYGSAFIDFNPGAGTNELNWGGSFDIYVNKLSPYPVSSPELVLLGTSYLFPNPTTSTTSLMLGNETKNAQLSIVDITGKGVYFMDNIKSDKVNLDLSYLNKGIYFVKVVADDKQEVIKLIKE